MGREPHFVGNGGVGWQELVRLKEMLDAGPHAVFAKEEGRKAGV